MKLDLEVHDEEVSCHGCDWSLYVYRDERSCSEGKLERAVPKGF
jgi:hypothetical protein